MSEVILSTRGVGKSFYSRGRRVHAMDSVDLDVREGEFLAIVGPSGCGKSTLLNLLVGLFPPTSGEVRFRGRPTLGINTQVGYVTQADNLLPWRTLRANVRFPLELRNVDTGDSDARANALIRQVGLAGFENHYPHELSGGMRQRANIVRTLIYNPDVILMDEPFGPLDAQTRLRLQTQLLELWEQNRKTIVFITHDLVEAIAMADRVVVMTARPGRIKTEHRVEMSRPRDVYHIHRSQMFRDLYDRLWEELRTEVDRSDV
ncbi:MAG: ABC transporter ATP-binding protein [Nitrospinota bacterium]